MHLTETTFEAIFQCVSPDYCTKITMPRTEYDCDIYSTVCCCVSVGFFSLPCKLILKHCMDNYSLWTDKQEEKLIFGQWVRL